MEKLFKVNASKRIMALMIDLVILVFGVYASCSIIYGDSLSPIKKILFFLFGLGMTGLGILMLLDDVSKGAYYVLINDEYIDIWFTKIPVKEINSIEIKKIPRNTVIEIKYANSDQNPNMQKESFVMIAQDSLGKKMFLEVQEVFSKRFPEKFKDAISV